MRRSVREAIVGFSLLGAVFCIVLMFEMNAPYAFFAVLTMMGFYLWISRARTGKGGIAGIFQGVILQTSRSLRILDRGQQRWCRA